MFLGVLFAILVFLNLVVREDVLTHFHIIFFLPKQDGDDFYTCLQLQEVLFRSVLSEWKRNVASPVWSKKRNKWLPNSRNPVYKPCCTYVRRVVNGKVKSTYDLHYVNPRLSDGGSADVGFYVLKYMMKDSDRETRLQRALHLNLSEEEYYDVWKLVRSKSFTSLHFGLAGTGSRKAWKPSDTIVSYVKRSIADSKRSFDFPVFFNPVDGSSFPLSRYYKSRGDIYTMDDFLDFYYKSKDGRPDNVIISDKDFNQQLKRQNDFNHSVNVIQDKLDSNSLDDLF